MPPGYEELYELYPELYGAPVDPAEQNDSLGAGGMLGSTAVLGGGAYAARNTRPARFVRSLPGRLTGGRTAAAGSKLAGRLGPMAGRAGTAARGAAAAAGSAATSPVYAGTAAAGVGVLGGGRAGTWLADNFEPYGGMIDSVGGAAFDDTPGDAASVGSEFLGRLGALFTGNADQAFAGVPFVSPYDDYEEALAASRPGGFVERAVTGRQATAAPVEVGPASRQAGPDEADVPTSQLGEYLADLEGRAVGVEQDYQKRVSELRGLYQLSETPEERAQLQYALGTLEAQRAAGHEVIQNAYGQAMSDNAVRADQVRANTARQVGEVGAIFDDASADVGGIVADAQGQYADSGLGVGATDVSGNVTDWVPMIEGEGARQQALTSQLGQISADDIAFLASALGGEQTAQQGDLQRMAMMYGADATMSHQARVQDRISAERMRLADQTAQAQQFYDTRRYGLDDTGIQLALDMYGRNLESAAGATQPTIPTDPQGAYIAGMDMLSQYGQAAIPFITNNGLIPPDDLVLILQSMGAAPAVGP